VQEPTAGRVTLLPPALAPAGLTQARSGLVARVELEGGDRTDTSGYVAPRAELYGRGPSSSWSGTPASQWPDPPESTRWYDFSVFVPRRFPLATDARWFLFTQWKGLRGGSPPVSLEIRDKRVYLQVTDDADDVGDVAVGAWNRFTVGIRFSTDADQGRVTLYRDGRLVDRKTRATLDVVDGKPDPVYLKQGIYRSSAWTQTQVLYFAPMTVTTQPPAGLDDE